MTRNAHLFNHRLFLSAHVDRLTNDLSLVPLALKFVLVGIFRVKFLDVEILNIGDGIGDAPGDMLVMPDDNARAAGEAGADDIDIARDQVTFVPDGRGSLAQVRVVAEDRGACCGHGAIDDPVIAAAKHAEAAQLFHLLVLLQQAEVDPLVFSAGRHDQGMSGIVAGLQLRGQFDAQFGNQTSAYDLSFPVAAQVPAHHLRPLDSIGGLPGFWLKA